MSTFSAGNVCRLCLRTDAPLRVIAGPLQDVYEKLTEITFNTPHRPRGACYLCLSQLKKCYYLMSRSERAEEVLRFVIRRGDLDEEFVAMMHRCELSYGLSVTPPEVIAITGTEDSLIKTEIMEDPQSSHRRPFVERFKFEEPEDEGDVKRAVLEDVDDIEDEGLIDYEDMKVEVLEEYLDIEELELTGEDYTLREQNEVQDVGIERLIREEDIKQELEAARVIEGGDSEGATPIDKCEETHENTQDRTTPTPDGENIMRGLGKRRAVLEEDTSSRSTGSYTFRSTKKAANNEQVLRNLSMCSDTTMNKDNVSVDSDNDCTNTDVDNSDSEHLSLIFICKDCGKLFYDKHLLTEHTEQHNIKRTSDRTSGEESSHQRTVLRKQRCSRTGVVNKHTDTRSGNKMLECDFCQRKFKQRSDLNRHVRIHTGVKPYECKICQAKFNLKGNLKIHLRTHTGEKPFKCEICQVKFTVKSNLKIHVRKHTGDKPFECEK